MARIQGVPRDQAGPMVKLVYWVMRKGMKQLIGREPARGSGIEPVEVWAHQPKLLSGMGKFQQAVRNAHTVDERLKNRDMGLELRPAAQGGGEGVRAGADVGERR